MDVAPGPKIPWRRHLHDLEAHRLEFSPIVGLTDREYIELLKAQYCGIIYVMVSHYIGNAAFEQCLFLTADRMMEIIRVFASFCS